MGHLTVRHRTGHQLEVSIRDHTLLVDQPAEAGGDDLGPTPTELFVAGLVACIAFFAEHYLRRHGFPDGAVRVDGSYGLSAERPSRVERIEVAVQVDAPLTVAQQAALGRVVEHCTVHHSLQEPPAIDIRLTSPERLPA